MVHSATTLSCLALAGVILLTGANAAPQAGGDGAIPVAPAVTSPAAATTPFTTVTVQTIIGSIPDCARLCFVHVFSPNGAGPDISPAMLCGATTIQQRELSQCAGSVCLPAELDRMSNPELLASLATACRAEYNTLPEGLGDPAAAESIAIEAATGTAAMPTPVDDVKNPGKASRTSLPPDSISIPQTLAAAPITGAVPAGTHVNFSNSQEDVPVIQTIFTAETPVVKGSGAGPTESAATATSAAAASGGASSVSVTGAINFASGGVSSIDAMAGSFVAAFAGILAVAALAC
ncbi:hypothetical protein HDU96_003260 [Phlyctochytrium bullatum]|nr:hypothetical protein HDU96_003260 [Phlyctochytrium bullatum]